MSEIDVIERQPLPIQRLLTALRRDFPELVAHAQTVLNDPDRPAAESEQIARKLLAERATWENSRRSRWAV